MALLYYIDSLPSIRIFHFLDALGSIIHPVMLWCMFPCGIINLADHLIICFSPSSHIYVGPPRWTTSVNKCRVTRPCSPESKNFLNQSPSLKNKVHLSFTWWIEKIHTHANCPNPEDQWFSVNFWWLISAGKTFEHTCRTSTHCSEPRFTIIPSPALWNRVGSILSSPPTSSPAFG